MALFGMITTAASRDYTAVALRSFFAYTPADQIEAFVLIDNDGDYTLPADLPRERVALLRHDSPLGFAQNANVLLAHAREQRADLMLLNNDLVFTAGWFEALLGGRPAIVSPLSNAESPRTTPRFALPPSLDLADFAGHEADLAAIAASNRATQWGFQTVASVPFFCVRIPREVYEAVGEFDERFGAGGGEDRDYALRAWLAGFPCQLAIGAYVLHFQGKSTWRGGEHPAGTQARNRRYTEAFRGKWGEALTYAFIGGGWNLFLSDPVLRLSIQRRQFKPAIERLQQQSSLAPFLVRQQCARFGAVCCIYDDDAWLEPMVESIYGSCAEILFLVGHRPWNGEATDQTPLLTRIRALDDPEGKIHIARGDWTDEAAQRNEGLRLLAERGIEYCLVVDADEVYDPAVLERAMATARQHPHIDCWRMHFYTYWKSVRYRVEPPERLPMPVFVRVGACRFTANRMVDTAQQAVIPAAQGMLHHLSYARSDAQIRRKIETFSHANEMVPGWYERVWLGWDRDRSMRNLNPCWPAAYSRIVEQDPAALPPALRRHSATPCGSREAAATASVAVE
jgi:GT2 family glycosyltransferase